MDVFFDTSAVVPLLIEEPGSPAALAIWAQAERAWAWQWLRVETEAALVRRKALPVAWANWRELALHIAFLDISEDLRALCDFNRALGLRAADAGHLFVCERLAQTIPALRLASLDQEQRSAATLCGLNTL